MTLCQFSRDKEVLARCDSWENIVYTLCSALNYLHNKSILHNDIKANNVVMYHSNSYMPVLIDFGKACFSDEAKKYALSKDERELYKSKYPHSLWTSRRKLIIVRSV